MVNTTSLPLLVIYLTAYMYKVLSFFWDPTQNSYVAVKGFVSKNYLKNYILALPFDEGERLYTFTFTGPPFDEAKFSQIHSHGTLKN